MDWYFDFISPYSYLQLERMPQWPKHATLVPKPILFAGLLNHWGQRGPAEIGPKRRFTYRQVHWLAARDGIPFRFPPRHPFNPINALRLAIAADCDLESIRTIFRFIWAEGRAIDVPEEWRELTQRVGIADADARIQDPGVKARLRANGEEAIAQDVFGVPTLVIDAELFWGYDATAMALDYLRDPKEFLSEEVHRIDALPIGVSRV
jgi:2-hydroxychromene-2-carboxylate isomerase